MTDNEIIKAYGCCNLNYDEGGGCDNCPCQIVGNCIARENFDLEREVYNVLNRQKAEIERLKTENHILSQKRINFFERIEIITAAEVRAVKEFAERLKKISDRDGWTDSSEIDNLVNEMTEPVKLDHNSLCETETYKG